MSVTDTAKHLNEKEKESLDVAEGARETEWTQPSFVAELFMGRFRTDLISPYPLQSAGGQGHRRRVHGPPGDLPQGKPGPGRGGQDHRDLPKKVIDGLAKLGCWGMKIPKEYGGLGLSQINYNRAVALVASYCGSTAVWLSAHQSIGVPQPLKLFGTEAQKKKYFPQFAKGAVSAFALTEPGVGQRSRPHDHHRRALIGRQNLDDQRLQTLVHQRPGGRRDGGHGPHAPQDGERQGEKADHRLHRGKGNAGHRIREPLRLHGHPRHPERRHQIQQREGALRKHPLGRGAGLEAGLDHPQHRAPHPARRLARA